MNKKTPFKPSTLASLLACCAMPLYAQETTTLDAIVVTAQKEPRLSAEQAQLARIAGGTNLIAAEVLEQKRNASLADVLQYQAGVYAQSPGNEGSKISIRGSGLNRAPGAHASGTFTLLDDIPLTGPGGTPYELLEAWWIDHAEVYRGGNAFSKGALALGGAINYASKTGLTETGQKIRYEIGGHGYQKYSFSNAGVQQDLDYYLALNASEYDGFQQLASGRSKGLMLNVGYQIQPNIETRFYARYRETAHQSPGRITAAQLKQDPIPANPYNVLHDTQRIQPGSTWLANQTTWQLPKDAKFQASLAYHHYPMDLQESPYRMEVDYSDLTAKLSYEKPYMLWGMPQRSKIAFRSTTHRPDSAASESLRTAQLIDGQNYAAGTFVRKYTYLGSDNVLQFEQELDLNEKLRVEAGLAASYTHRETEVIQPATSDRLSLYEWNFAPRLGLIYQIHPELQAFANITRSVEPAHPWSMIWGTSSRFPSGNGPATGRQNSPVVLNTQTANSFEIGGRGQNQWADWSLNYYYAALKNELLSVEVQRPNTPVYVAESNASATIHQGLELALHHPLYRFASGQLSLDQAYTWSHFYFKDDAILAKNELAGIPAHYYQARLQYQHDSGLYMALNTEYASKMPVDYANTVYSDAYHIWGLNFGYRPAHEKWQLWLDLRNLGNERYATTVTPTYNDKGMDVAHYTPAEGFSSYAGISVRF